MEVIAGPDAFDATAMQEPLTPVTKGQPKKVAYLKTAVDNPAVDEGVRKAFMAQLELLENAGVVVEPVELELLNTLVPFTTSSPRLKPVPTSQGLTGFMQVTATQKARILRAFINSAAAQDLAKKYNAALCWGPSY